MWTIICETQKSVLASCKIAVKNCDCLQALDLSDAFLTKLNVARESVDDTASATEYVVSNGRYKAGVIASRQAAEIYRLNIQGGRELEPFTFITLTNTTVHNLLALSSHPPPLATCEGEESSYKRELRSKISRVAIVGRLGCKPLFPSLTLPEIFVQHNYRQPGSRASAFGFREQLLSISPISAYYGLLT
ncbi:hypothetical protein K1719_017969 [Acacia pycnantha]|nr:hypothetical protein K1719_017969 [Acacia pycnantha]